MGLTRSLLCLSLALLAGCVTTRVEESVQQSVFVHDDESIVVLGRGESLDRVPEASFISCVSQHLGSGNDSLNVFDSNAFVDHLFPWFEPRLAPLTPEALPDLLAKPGVANRLETSGVRYIVWMDGSTQITDGGGQMSCDISLGCFGFNWWENGGTYEASIWDLENATAAAIISTDVTGRSYMPAVVLPIPLIAPTKRAACASMADQLRDFLNRGG